jgi:hypothetical protein
MFKFSIRDLFWLTVVVALAVGWWLDRRALDVAKTQVEELNTQVKELSAEILQRDTSWMAVSTPPGQTSPDSP